MILHLLRSLLYVASSGEQSSEPSIATSTVSVPSTNTSPSVLRNSLPPPSVIPEIPNNRSITITNNCDTDIWPALLTASNSGGPYTQGFLLHSNESRQLWFPPDWIGRIWGRTNCTFSETTNTGSCFTGSCNDALNCSVSGEPPATLAEFTLLGSDAQTFYDLSLVNGFNLPMAIIPSANGSRIACSWLASPESILAHCPETLLFYGPGSFVAGCMSACDEFQPEGPNVTDKFCCTGQFNTSKTCPPTNFSEVFKEQCPNAYSYAFDDPTSLFTMPSDPLLTFEVAFCPCIPYYDSS